MLLPALARGLAHDISKLIGPAIDRSQSDRTKDGNYCGAPFCGKGPLPAFGWPLFYKDVMVSVETLFCPFSSLRCFVGQAIELLLLDSSGVVGILLLPRLI